VRSTTTGVWNLHVGHRLVSLPVSTCGINKSGRPAEQRATERGCCWGGHLPPRPPYFTSRVKNGVPSLLSIAPGRFAERPLSSSKIAWRLPAPSTTVIRWCIQRHRYSALTSTGDLTRHASHSSRKRPCCRSGVIVEALPFLSMKNRRQGWRPAHAGGGPRTAYLPPFR